jgi:hypothetical protein
MKNERQIYFTVGSHEPLSHRLRTGNVSKEEIKLFKNEHSKENVDRLKDLGVNLIHTYCYKGFGLKAEKELINEVGEFAKYCHKLNIKVSAYFQTFPVYYETLFNEIETARNWLQIDYLGRPIIYGWQYFRHLACPNSEEFINYLEKVLKYVLEKVDFDFIMFDNVGWSPEPCSCHCKNCQKKFKEFLVRKYNCEIDKQSKDLKNIIGVDSLKYVELPHYDPYYPPDSLKKIRDPILQDWIIFRCKSIADVLERLYKIVKNFNKEINVSANIGTYPYFNSAYIRGEYLPYLAKGIDEVTFEAPFHSPRILENKAVLNHIRTYKMAYTLNKQCSNGESYSDESYYKLYIANTFAFNRTSNVCAGYILTKNEDILERKKYYDFLDKHKMYYSNIETMAEVAVLRSFSSLSYSFFEPLYSVIMLEQLLLLKNIPFDIIFDENLNNLKKYKVLVLANVEALSDDQIQLIKKFVEIGGSLLVTENTSFYDERYRPREIFGFYEIFRNKDLKEILSIKPPHNVPMVKEEKVKNIIKVQYGRGKAVYIPKVIPSVEFDVPRDPYFPFKQVYPKYIMPPKNCEEIFNSLKWLLNDNLLIKIKQNAITIAELTRQKDTKEIILHLVNFDIKKRSNNIEVELNIKNHLVKEIYNFSFEHRPRKIKFKKKGDKIIFKVRKFKTYELIVLK